MEIKRIKDAMWPNVHLFIECMIVLMLVNHLAESGASPLWVLSICVITFLTVLQSSFAACKHSRELKDLRRIKNEADVEGERLNRFFNYWKGE